MSSRKVFTDENGKELSYHLILSEKLLIAITKPDGFITGVELNKTDALSFIQELNKLKKQLRDEN